jgi:hypothetical protein
MKSLISAGLLIAAGLPMGVSAASAEPDLVVSSGNVELAIQEGNIAFREPTDFIWSHTTKNIGSAAARKKTNTEIEINEKRPTPGGLLLVKPLARGASDDGDGAFSVNFRTWKFGSYPTRICADAFDAVPESNESNNCQFIRPVHVVPRRLKGRITAELDPKPPNTIKHTWSADVVLEGKRFVDANVALIEYAFKDLVVNYKVQGRTSGGCRQFGQTVDLPGTPNKPQTITLRFGLSVGGYSARNLPFSEGFTVPITITCPDSPPITIQVPPQYPWFSTRGSKEFPNPGLERLKGTYTVDTAGGKLTETWNLEALD